MLASKNENARPCWAKRFSLLVRPARFELATYGFVDEAELSKLLKLLEP